VENEIKLYEKLERFTPKLVSRYKMAHRARSLSSDFWQLTESGENSIEEALELRLEN